MLKVTPRTVAFHKYTMMERLHIGSNAQLIEYAVRNSAAAAYDWSKYYDKLERIQWNGFSKEDLASIKVPILVMVGDHDFVRIDHTAESFKLIPGAELVVIPSASHFILYSEPERVIPIVKHFLEKPENELPIAIAETGYHPGETR